MILGASEICSTQGLQNTTSWIVCFCMNFLSPQILTRITHSPQIFYWVRWPRRLAASPARCSRPRCLSPCRQPPIHRSRFAGPLSSRLPSLAPRSCTAPVSLLPVQNRPQALLPSSSDSDSDSDEDQPKAPSPKLAIGAYHQISHSARPCGVAYELSACWVPDSSRKSPRDVASSPTGPRQHPCQVLTLRFD